MHQLTTQLLDMVESGLIGEDVAPEAAHMLPKIIRLAEQAEQGALFECAKHLSWASKLLWLSELANEDGTALNSPTARLADHDFCSTDPDRGALWRLWEAGAVDPLCDLAEAEACLVDGPSTGRDWARGKIIERFYDRVESVDWSYVSLRAQDERWSSRLRIEFPSLESHDRETFQMLLAEAVDPTHLHDLLANFGGTDVQQTNGLDDLTNQLAVVPRNQDAERPRKTD
jgi:hypothetical protein